MRRRLALCLVAGLAGGCASTDRPRKQAAVRTEWHQGKFHVRFEAGSRTAGTRWTASYRIEHADAGPPRPLVLPSAHSLDGFASVVNANPRDWIRLIAAADGSSLLIEEEIPNDCGPCTNYLLVRPDAHANLTGTWLRLPSKATGHNGGINEEFPRVRSIEGRVLVFSFSDGAIVRATIESIDKGEGPVPPG